MINKRWYVITGGPSTGKSTTLTELKKMGHITIPEAARAVIDEGRSRGLTTEQIRKDEKKFQIMVLHKKIEIESVLDKDVLTFLDRGIHDSIAYFNYYGWTLDKYFESALNKASYQLIFLLDLLPFFEKDHARTEDYAFTKSIHQQLEEAYKKYRYNIIRVPVMNPKKRANFILDTVKKHEQGVT